MYRDDLKGASWRRGLKAAFWMVVGVAALVFVHYYALERSLQQSHATQGVRNVMESIHHSAATGGGYAVFPDDPSRGGDGGPDCGVGAWGGARPKPSAPPHRHHHPGPDFAAPSAKIDDLGLQEVVLSSLV